MGRVGETVTISMRSVASRHPLIAFGPCQIFAFTRRSLSDFLCELTYPAHPTLVDIASPAFVFRSTLPEVGDVAKRPTTSFAYRPGL